jgi:hypothetical protein|tara:strand:+ start:7582 stop:7824 length:243 start_codon:yes stop_codon:yes gene_type:complete
MGTEKEAVGLTKVGPFLVEDELIGLDAVFSKMKDWGVVAPDAWCLNVRTRQPGAPPCRLISGIAPAFFFEKFISRSGLCG